MGSLNAERPGIIFLAPTPPPYMGPSVATDVLLGSRLTREFRIIHIDTADRRPLQTLGRIDLVNVALAFKHYGVLLYRLMTARANAVYLLINQTRIGFLRDMPFVIMGRVFGKRVILHLRGGYFREFYDASGPVMRFLVRATLRRTDRMIVLGESLRRLFDGLMDADRISVVPNGMDLSCEWMEARQGTEAGVTVLFLSNMIASKGYGEVLESAVEVTRVRSDVRYVFAGAWGSEADMDACERFVRERGLSGRVEFRGAVSGDAKAALLALADIFVLPTYYPAEGLPWAIIEAMACGLPVISTDHGAIAECVWEGVNGFLVEKKSPGAIAAKVIALASDREMRMRMGAESRRLYLEKFTEEAMIRAFLKACHETL